MALPRVTYGRKRSESEPDYGVIAAGVMRACVFDPATKNIWYDKIGAWLGKATGTNATARLAVGKTDNSLNPTNRTAYSDAATISVSNTGPGGGQPYELDVAVADDAPTNNAGMIWIGESYWIGPLATSAPVGHSMRQASAISAANEQFYEHAGLTQPPPATFGAYTSSVEGHMTAWVIGEENVQPLKPLTGMAPSGTISSITPTFTADFNDLNGSYGDSSGDGVDRGDRLNQYKIQVRPVGGSTSSGWNTTVTATSGEIAADAVSIAYGGTALTPGTTYEWRIQMSDQFGEWSNWSDWVQFTPASLGVVTLDGTPDPLTPLLINTGITWQGRWFHQTGTSTNAVQIRLLSSSGTVLKTSAVISKTVASSADPGTLFSIAHSDTGFGTLAWGRVYQYQIQGRDTGGNWSGWSLPRSFSTNSAPSVPTNLSPASGSDPISTYPLLSCSFGDNDDVPSPGNLTGVFRITQPDSDEIDVTPTYNALTNKWEFQTTATEFDAYGTYSWKATGYDGTLYSGESTSLGSATWSSSATIVYADVPAVTITSPVDLATITTSSLSVAWTGSGQVKYQVWATDVITGTVVYDSGQITSASQAHDIPSGKMRNGRSYEIKVAITSSAPLTGYGTVTIDVSFTPPDAPTNFQANPASFGGDPEPTAIRCTWDQTSYSTPEFVKYVLRRWATVGVDAAEVILAEITNPATTSFVDFTPSSGIEHTYGIQVVTVTGLDEVSSDDSVIAVAMITLNATVITSVTDGENYRVYLPNVTERAHDRKTNEAFYAPLSGGPPVTIRTRTRYQVGSYTAMLVGTSFQSPGAQRSDFEDLDARQGTVCVRDSFQRKRFFMIESLQIRDEFATYFTAEFTLRQESYTEGVLA